MIYQVRVRKAGVPEGKWTICLYTLYLGTIFILYVAPLTSSISVVQILISRFFRNFNFQPLTLALKPNSIRGIFRCIEFGTGTGSKSIRAHDHGALKLTLFHNYRRQGTAPQYRGLV